MASSILVAVAAEGGSGNPTWMQHLSSAEPIEELSKENLKSPLKVKGSGIVQVAF